MNSTEQIQTTSQTKTNYDLKRFPFEEKFRFGFQKFPATIEQHFPEFPEKRTILRGIPKVSEISDQEFLFHLCSLPEFPVEWLAFRKPYNFRIFW